MDRGTTSAAVAGALAALVGGLLWVLAWVGVGALAWWPGAVLLVVAAVAVGAGLVDRGVTPLRLVVGLCLAVLGWALLAVVGGVSGVVDADGAARVDGIVGAVLALLGAAVVGRELRRRHRTDEPDEPDHPDEPSKPSKPGEPGEPGRPGGAAPSRRRADHGRGSRAAPRSAPGRRRTGGAHAG